MREREEVVPLRPRAHQVELIKHLGQRRIIAFPKFSRVVLGLHVVRTVDRIVGPLRLRVRELARTCASLCGRAGACADARALTRTCGRLRGRAGVCASVSLSMLRVLARML